MTRYYKIPIAILTLLTVHLGMAQKKKVEFTGLGRAYFFNNSLDISKSQDSVTSPKSNYGTTLVDLGVNVFPNKNTELLGVFRISNKLGGFWGGGVDFNVRQLTLKGVAADKIRYKLGDIDLKLTEYTLFNNFEDGFVNEPAVFSIMREVPRYEMFYIDNYWRMQGAQAEFGLQMRKLVDEVNFNGFLTRQNVANGVSVPERLLGGGSIQFLDKDLFQIQYNNTSVFDVSKTVPDTALYSNSVNSVSWEGYKDLDKFTIGLKGESGISRTSYQGYVNPATPDDFNDSFLDAQVYMRTKDKTMRASLSFVDVGPDFRSPSAQTQRMNYNKSPSLYSIITNNNVLRPLSGYDFLSLNSVNNRNISYELSNYLVYYNNTLPYGKATPNRRGITLGVSKQDSAKTYNLGLNVYSLSEIRGEGTFEKRKFLLANVIADVYINKLISWKRDVILNGGIRYESVNRGGQVYETVSLNSMLVDLGLTVEFQDNLDLITGIKLINSSGNEFIDKRNSFNTLNELTPTNFNLSENIIAAGLRYRFSEKVHLSAVWQGYQYDNPEDALKYGINQFFILYNMKF